jgi:hypothetical protein
MELALSTLISVVSSVALWALLPRGVVLTRAMRARGEWDPLMESWTLTNDSPLPVTFISVKYCSPETFDPVTDTIREIDVPADDGAAGATGVLLRFDDEVLEVRRQDHHSGWSGLSVPPGDTVSVFMSNNRTLRIRYRRSGWTGHLERRRLEVHSGV